MTSGPHPVLHAFALFLSALSALLPLTIPSTFADNPMFIKSKLTPLQLTGTLPDLSPHCGDGLRNLRNRIVILTSSTCAPVANVSGVGPSC